MGLGDAMLLRAVGGVKIAASAAGRMQCASDALTAYRAVGLSTVGKGSGHWNNERDFVRFDPVHTPSLSADAREVVVHLF